MIEVSEDLPTNTTMKVVSVFKKGAKKHFTVECPDCLSIIEVRADAVKLGGYKEQKLCRICSYKEMHGVEHVGLTEKYRYIYLRYMNMIRRCTSPEYKNYEGKGVTVSKEWNTFKPFLDWVLEQGFTDRDLKSLELDKDYLCDLNGISPKVYGPSTCRLTSRHLNNVIKPKTSKKTTSQYIGVSYNRSLKRYETSIRSNYDRIFRAYGKTELEAAQKREQFIIDNRLPHTRNF